MENKEFVVCDGQKSVSFRMNEAIYIRSEGHYVNVYMKGGIRSESCRVKISELEKTLSIYGFIRIHRRYLVNCRMIKELRRGECVLKTGGILPTGRKFIT